VRATGFVLAVATSALVGFFGYTSLGASPTEAAPPAVTHTSTPKLPANPPRDRDAGDDGRLPGDVTVFNDRFAGVTKLDPDLLRALRAAATDADGVTFYVTSGWRSADYQAQLLNDAISKYGSEQEAARWVATPETSPHVFGDAVDIGKSDAATWLSKHGARYGLCQIYGNEPWHYELRPEAVDQGCPGMYADPTHDPRMQQ
jgi:D-alanyl-D-alanine carboxypeptidase